MEIGPLSNKRPVLVTAENRAELQPKVDLKRGQGDVIEISYSGRRKLAELADAALKSKTSGSNTRETSEHSLAHGLDRTEAAGPSDDREDRIRRIHERIDSGFYDRSDVKKTIAERLLDDMDT